MTQEGETSEIEDALVELWDKYAVHPTHATRPGGWYFNLRELRQIFRRAKDRPSFVQKFLDENQHLSPETQVHLLNYHIEVLK